VGGLYVDVLVGYSFRAIAHWLRARGSANWPTAEATVTAEPLGSHSYGGPTVEIVYSYRFENELYTGMHEEPFLSSDAMVEFVERFSKGRKFVVRVKADEPELSILWDEDQIQRTQSEG
jgi:hypothetical protein